MVILLCLCQSCEVTNDTVLPRRINNLVTGETFKSFVVVPVPVTHTAAENVQKKMGGIPNQPDNQLFSSCQPKTQTILSSCCW